MAYIKGTATFTNGSATVTSVSLNQGVISLVSSGTNLVVGFDPVVGNIEATGTNGTNITLRNVWSGTTGSYEFVAFDTIEGLADAVQSARGFSTALQDALNTIGTPSTTVTPDSIAKRDSVGRLESATGASGNDVLTFGNVQTSPTDATAGRVMTVGAFGLGGNIFRGADNVRENTLATGFYKYNDGTGGPSDTDRLILINMFEGEGANAKIAIDNRDDTIHFSTRENNVDKPWQELYHTGNLELQTSATDATSGRVMTVGAFGLGSTGILWNTDYNNTPNYNCRLSTSNLNVPNLPTAGIATVDNIESVNGNCKTQVAYTQTTISGGNSIGRIHFRNTKVGDAEWQDWQELYHTGNTTVDGSGFIKEASPIVKVFADKAEFNDQCPDEIEFEKVATGHYLIKNTPGFAKKGWYIETPKDANNNVKVYVEYDQLEDDTIEIKTYEPDYSNGYCGKGGPTDITKDRWIDVRLGSEVTTLDSPDSN